MTDFDKVFLIFFFLNSYLKKLKIISAVMGRARYLCRFGHNFIVDFLKNNVNNKKWENTGVGNTQFSYNCFLFMF